jgi:DNA-binding MarR family transcriptional regulator
MSETVFRLDNYLPFRLFVASSSVSTLLSSACSVIYGMKMAEWRIVAALSESGPATQQDLVRHICMDKVSVSRAVQALVKQRLVARAIAPDDGRSHLVDLTSEGRRVLSELVRAANIYEAALVADFTPAEVDILKKALTRVQFAADHARHPARLALQQSAMAEEVGA